MKVAPNPTAPLLQGGLGGGSRELPLRVVSAKVNLRNRFVDIWQARELVIFLVRKELKVRYKNSVLGFLWSFLNPALVLLVYYVVFKYFLENHIDLFAIYLFAGLLPWNLFNNSLLSSAGVLVAQAGIVKKVAFPREILALAQVGTSICYFFFQACIMVCFPRRLRGDAGLEVPARRAARVRLRRRVLGGARSLPFGGHGVSAGRPAPHRGPAGGGFFSAPIVYMFTTVGTKLHQHGALWVYFLNPLVTIVLAFQRFIYGTVAPKDHPIPIATYGEHWYLAVLSVILLISVALFMVAMVIFGRVEGNFAEEL